MERRILARLKTWQYQDNRKPLIVRGARQVGKSYIISHFGKTCFDGEIYIINLEKRPDWHIIFDTNLDAKRILAELEIVMNASFTPGKDLLFFDEIQECPKAIMALRYIYEYNPELHVIAAGSLLEFALQDISFPVGRIQLMNMYPMSFSEFLVALGQNRLLNSIQEDARELAPAVHQLIIAQLKTYFFVGGMPECVSTYKDTGKMTNVQQVQSDLINTYRQDFSKYTPLVDSRCIDDVMAAVSSRVGQQLKYVHLSSRFSGPTIKKALGLLSTARLLHLVYSTSPSALPLSSNISNKRFKAILLDIGLMVRLSGLSIGKEYHQNELLSIFKGALAEQFVGQELLAHGQEQLFHWSRSQKSSTAEIDYLIENEGQIMPVEVKNSAAGRLKSMHLILREYSNLKEGLVFSDAKFGEIPEQKLKFFPLYYVSKFGEKDSIEK